MERVTRREEIGADYDDLMRRANTRPVRRRRR